jgi:hypothetical protein
LPFVDKNTVKEESKEAQLSKIFEKLNSKLAKLTYSKNRGKTNKLMSFPQHFIGKNTWLLKPSENNRGRGIYIFNTIEKLKSLIKDLKAGILISEPTAAQHTN